MIQYVSYSQSIDTTDISIRYRALLHVYDALRDHSENITGGWECRVLGGHPDFAIHQRGASTFCQSTEVRGGRGEHPDLAKY